MGSIDGYIFRQIFVAFVIVLVTLTGIVWLTQALRGIDVITSRGQTILTFFGLTSLAIPYLLLVIAPFALVIATVYVLNRLANDSEIIVIHASGLKPWRLFLPFLAVALVVSTLVFAISSFIAPHSLRVLNDWRRQIAADVISNVLQTGRFLDIETNLTLRVRERQPGGLLVGIFVDDRRDPKERTTIIADRGTVLKNEKGSYLVLEDGNLQRSETNRREPALVAFDRYAFDMSKFASVPRDSNYSIRERYLWELFDPDPDDPLFKLAPGRFRAELHDRLNGPLYPLAFIAITFAFLGAPRTARQNRTVFLSNVVFAVIVLRIFGFACTVLAATWLLAVPVQYAVLLAAFALSMWTIVHAIVLEPPAVVTDTIASLTERLSRRFAPS